MLSREQKLEAAVKAALRLRRMLYSPLTEYELEPPIMYVSAEEIEKFDQTIKELKDEHN